MALRPGDPFQRALNETLIREADAARTRELVTLTRGAGLTAGQLIALCLGVPPAVVAEISEALLTPPPDG